MSEPFWKLESRYVQERYDLEWECAHAETLADAVRAGANMTTLDGKNAGWLGEDGELQDTNEELDYSTAVKFIGLDRDDDGYAIAVFETE